jgi:hypothetical protein
MTEGNVNPVQKAMIAVDADGEPRQIVGFYTVIPHEFRGEELPDPLRKATRAGSLSAILAHSWRSLPSMYRFGAMARAKFL